MNKFFGFCVVFTKKKKKYSAQKVVHLHFSEYMLLNK